MAVWFGAYLVAVGPFVRWQAGDSALWWAVAAAVMASPFLVVAWRGRRQGQSGRKPRTWLSLTQAGRAAFSTHLAVLNRIAGTSTGNQDGAALSENP